MNYEVLGVRRSEGTSKKTGKPYAGYIVFYSYKPRNISGDAFDNSFVPDDLLDGYEPQPGDKIQLFFDKNGYLQDFVLV